MKTLKVFFAFFLALGMLFSCEEQGVQPGASLEGDDALILAIQQASNKIAVSSADLPSVTNSALTQEYSDSYIAMASKAANLGYEVSMRRQKGAEIGEKLEAYFDTAGKPLRPRRKGKGENEDEKNKCFEFVFPVSFIMSDGTMITAESGQELAEAIKSWYQENNPETKERPEPVYPVTLSFNGEVKVIANAAEMKAVRERCKSDRKEEKRCFELVFPITVVLSDGSTITGSDKNDLGQQFRSWATANPNASKRHELQYPVTVQFADGSTKEINSRQEMKGLKERCDD